MSTVSRASSQFFTVAARGTGNPAAGNRVLLFRTVQPGPLSVRFTADDNPITVTVRVSEDNSTFANTSAANNTTAVVNVVIAAKGSRDIPLNLRSADRFVDILATGNGTITVVPNVASLEVLSGAGD